MKKTTGRQFLLLCLPVVFFVVFPFIHAAKPTLRLKSVSIEPAVSRLAGKVMKGQIAVKVFTDYRNPSIRSLFTEQPGLWFNISHGLYIEDENGVIYGRGNPPRDKKTYRPFTSQYGPYGLYFRLINNDPYAWYITVPLNQIPKSAGRLTLKTILESGDSSCIVQLPISVVIRQ